MLGPDLGKVEKRLGRRWTIQFSRCKCLPAQGIIIQARTFRSGFPMGKYLPVPLHERGCAKEFPAPHWPRALDGKAGGPVQEPVSIVLLGTHRQKRLCCSHHSAKSTLTFIDGLTTSYVLPPTIQEASMFLILPVPFCPFLTWLCFRERRAASAICRPTPVLPFYSVVISAGATPKSAADVVQRHRRVHFNQVDIGE